MITNARVKKCKVTKKQIEIIGLIGIFIIYKEQDETSPVVKNHSVGAYRWVDASTGSLR